MGDQERKWLLYLDGSSRLIQASTKLQAEEIVVIHGIQAALCKVYRRIIIEGWGIVNLYSMQSITYQWIK